MGRPLNSKTKKPTKEKLLEAAFVLVRNKGYTATTVDDLCNEANVTKGTFFHYFKNKEIFGVEAARHWSKVTASLFENADYHRFSDPLERLLGYVKFRKEILQGKTSEFTCLVGTMVQEIYSSYPEINKACFQSIFNHAETLESDISEAKKLYSPKAKWTPKSLALYTQAVIQGSFILAKSSGESKFAADSIDHLENYIHLLFKK